MGAEAKSTNTTFRTIVKRFVQSEASWIWIGLVILVVISAIIAPTTLTGRALMTMLPVAAVLAIASIGQALTIQQGGIDFSVPGVITMSAVLVTGVSQSMNSGLWQGIGMAMLVACVVGAVNGLSVAFLRIPAVIVTLAVNVLVVGGIVAYAGGSPRQAPENLTEFAIGRTLGAPNIAIIAIAVVALAVILQTRMVIGRRFVAIGDNPATARAMGMPVTRYVVGTYIVAAFCSGLAGIMLAGYVVSPSLLTGNPYLLTTITAVIIGGTAFGGGRARLIGAAVAAIFLTQLDSVLNAIGAPTSISMILQAAAIAIAIGVGPTINLIRRLRQSRSMASIDAPKAI